MKRISVREAKKLMPPEIMQAIRDAALDGQSEIFVRSEEYNVGIWLKTLGYRAQREYGQMSGYWVRW